MAMFKNIIQKLENIAFIVLFITVINLNVFVGTIIYKDLSKNEEDIEDNVELAIKHLNKKIRVVDLSKEDPNIDLANLNGTEYLLMLEGTRIVDLIKLRDVVKIDIKDWSKIDEKFLCYCT